MPLSFHSHSGQYCMHAKGNLEDIVLSAIAKGFTHYGLSEHMPRSREQVGNIDIELSITSLHIFIFYI